jgi:nicotinate-nucleotide pyrophosphorylase (carboxylating)
MLNRREIEPIVEMALAEDLPWGDVTTDAMVQPEWRIEADVVSKARGVLAGMDVLTAAFHLTDPETVIQWHVQDGARLEPGDRPAHISGRAHALLKAERVALNFIQRLSGIATLTERYVTVIEGTTARIVDTRKTTPGLRLLEKYAVRVGGGHNHRYCLSDGVLIKDNHLAMLRASGKTLQDAVALARARVPHGVRVEVEVTSLAEVDAALAAGADAILLDNMGPDLLGQAVQRIRGQAITEASGGITLENVRAVAESGVDIISVGALTHSAPALDISLDFRGT